MYFVFPIKAIWLLWIFGGISLFFTLVPTPRDMGMAHAAHLGGILAGIAWVKLGWHRDVVQLPWEGWLDRIRGSRRNGPARQQRVEPGEEPETDFMKDEVDAVLDKISAQGIQSLNARERSILESARKKMSRK